MNQSIVCGHRDSRGIGVMCCVGLTRVLALAISTAGFAVQAAAQEAKPLEIRGRLEIGDETDSAGYYIDRHTFAGTQGEIVQVDLVSEDFDTFLAVSFGEPRNFTAIGDEWERSRERAHLLLTLPETGEYTAWVMSNRPHATGDYDLRIVQGAAATADLPTAGWEAQYRGRLQTTDEQMDSGSYYDMYQFDCLPGQLVVAVLTSTEFDPYLAASTSSDAKFFQDNEDYADDSEHPADEIARLEFTADFTGTLSLFVRSDQRERTGRYELSISVSEAPPPLAEGERQREVGRLTSVDDQLNTGEFIDKFDFAWQAGQRIVIEMHSEDFTPYVFVQTAKKGDDVQWDQPGENGRSRLELQIPEDGAYELVATSMDRGEMGAYDVEIRVLLPNP